MPIISVLETCEIGEFNVDTVMRFLEHFIKLCLMLPYSTVHLTFPTGGKLLRAGTTTHSRIEHGAFLACGWCQSSMNVC